MRPIAKPENEREEETQKKLSSVTTQVEVLQKLIFPQLVSRNCPNFTQPERSVSCPKRPAVLARSIQSTPPPIISNEYPFIIIFPSTSRSSKWLLFLRLPHQNPVRTSPFPHTCYMPRRSYSSWFDHTNNAWWRGQRFSLERQTRRFQVRYRVLHQLNP